jgi:hypothetical protein
MKTLIYTIEKTTDAIWSGLTESYSELIRFSPPKIKLCNRIYRTAGYCEQEENLICLSNKLFTRNHSEMLRVILTHEIAHQADFNLFGFSEKKCGHGKKWAEIMLELGLPADKYHYLDV